ncbi:TPA: hypothetical protein ACGUP3_002271 [Vibrio vulnificus]
MINRERGATTLLVTSVLLIAALMATLGSYKTLLYQIKRAQNEVLSRQSYWKAEGGLECAFALVRQQGDILAATTLFPSTCKNPLGLSNLAIDSNNKITSKVASSGHATISKTLKLSRGASSGALKSSSDLYINGSATFSTPDPGNFDDGWECTAIRYKSAFHSRSGATNQGVIHGSVPYQGFNHKSKDCKASHKTNISADTGYGDDFIQDDTLEPFYDLFRVQRSNWSSVKTNLNFATVNFDNVSDKIVTDCGKKVADQINAGKRRIWVTGSCEFTSSKKVNGNYLTDSNGNPIKGGIDHISEAFVSSGGEPVLLLVHNGIFAAHGAMTFPGMLYQLNTTAPTNLDTLWDNFEAKDHFAEVVHFTGLSKNRIVYFQRGAFTFSGGQVLDSPSYAAYFANSLNFAFNRDNIEEVVDPVIFYAWEKGSWNDL